MKIAVTGVSSYLARTLMPLLEADAEIESIVGVDIRKPEVPYAKLKFVKKDVRDPELYREFEGCEALVHLAFIVMPIGDTREATDININGSINAFESAARAGINKIVYSSSVAAYGAWPDNPQEITEDVPVRGMPEFYYSYTKAEVEKYLDKFQEKNPGMTISRLRPCIFIGPKIDNLVRRLIASPIGLKFSGIDTRLQLVWDEDIADAIHVCIKEDHPGAFNLAGDNPLTNEEFAETLGMPAIKLPFGVAKFFSRLGRKLGIGNGDYSGWIDCLEYSIIANCDKAKRELKWQPRYDTKGALLKLLEYKEELKEAEKKKSK